MSRKTDHKESCYQEFRKFGEERIRRKEKRLQKQITKAENIFEKYAFSDTVKFFTFQDHDNQVERKSVFLSLLDIEKLAEEFKKDYCLLFEEENPECYRLYSEWDKGYLYQYMILVPRNEELYPLKILVERYIEPATYDDITLDVFCEVSRNFLITEIDLPMRTLYNNQYLSLEPVKLSEKMIEIYFKVVYLKKPVKVQVEGEKPKFESLSGNFEEEVKSFYKEIKDKTLGEMVEKKLKLEDNKLWLNNGNIFLELKGVNKEEDVFAYLDFEKGGETCHFKVKHKVTYITLKATMGCFEINDEFKFSDQVIEEGILADYLDRIQKEEQ